MKTNHIPSITRWPAALTLVLATSALLPACNRPAASGPSSDKSLTTPETLVGDYRKNQYEKNPSAENARKMDRALYELDSEIRELQELSARTSGDDKARAEEKLALLQRKRNELASDYNEAKYRSAVDEAKAAVKSFGEAIKAKANQAGQAIKDSVTPDEKK